MAAPASTATEQREQEKQEKSKPQLIVVELAKQRTPKQIKRLRKGQGKLVADIDEVVSELMAAGTIKANSQPVVLIVREASLPWPLSAVDDDDDDDD